MRKRLTALLGATGLLAAGLPVFAQQHQIGLTLGHLFGMQRNAPGGALHLGSGAGLQANYGYRLAEWSKVALIGEVHFLASPLRDIDTINVRATRDVASLYLTPGLKLQFAPKSSFSPFVVAGGGYGLYEQSLLRIDGQPNMAPRHTHRGVFTFGGGVDFPIWRFLGGRWEVRDFYSGNPSFNFPTSSSGQHNVVVGGGITIRFR